MKQVIFILSIILSIASCTQDHDFKYQGEMPSYNFEEAVSRNGEIIIRLVNTDSILPRNRIYINVDSLGNIILNSHQVPFDEFETAFEFVFTNPEQLSHLPISYQNATIYFNGFIPLIEKQGLAFSIILDGIVDMFFKYSNPDDEIKEHQSLFRTSDKTLNYFNTNVDIHYIGMTAILLDINKGINVKLPPYSEEIPETIIIKQRNVFRVLVNSKNQIIAREKEIQISELKNLAKEFISNPEKKSEYSVNPKNAIISLQNSRGTSYDTYLTVYNTLKEAYFELWNEEAQMQFNKNYDDLNQEQQRIIKEKIPLVISEAEPIE